MNGIVPAGKPASVEVSYSDPSLFVGLQLYDDSGVAPVPVGPVVAMLNWVGAAYRAKVSGTAGLWYLYRVAAYTDGTYTVIDTDQPQGSGSLYFMAQDISGLDIEGEIDQDVEITGEITTVEITC